MFNIIKRINQHMKQPSIVLILYFSITSICFSQIGQTPCGDCAHPIDFQQTSCKVIFGGVLRFTYSWRSSTGHLPDLDRVWVGEHTTCPNNGILPKPPWANNVVTPTITPERTVNSGTWGGIVDRIFPPGSKPNWDPPLIRWPGPNGERHTFSTTQNLGYHCCVCDSRDIDDALGWQVNFEKYSDILISKYYGRDESSAYGGWIYRVTKNGCSASRQIR